LSTIPELGVKYFDNTSALNHYDLTPKVQSFRAHENNIVAELD